MSPRAIPPRARARALFLLALVSTLALQPDRATAANVDRRQVEKILPAFEAYVRKAMETWKTPGIAIAIVLGDRTIYARGFGYRHVGRPEKVDPKTIFPIGSTAKGFASASLAMAVDAGHLRWSDRVVDHLPEFRLHDPWVTREFRIFDLAAQNSGLPDHSVTELSNFGYGRKRIMRAVAHVRPIAGFRSEFAYQNVFFLIAGELVARKAGEPNWETFAKKRIFDPLGMRATSTSLAAYRSATNVATPHVMDGGAVQPVKVTSFAYTFGASGGINSNVEDMAKWMSLHLNRGRFGGKQIISERNLAFTHRAQIAVSNDMAYAQGWVVSQRTPYPMVWHNGTIPGILNVVLTVPQAGLGIVILTNSTPSMPEPLAVRFFDMVFGNPATDYVAETLIHVKAHQAASRNVKRPSPAAPPAASLRYLGAYRNPAMGTISVAKDGSGMTLVFGPRRYVARLVPWDGDRFRVQFTGVLAEPGMEDGGFVTFERGVGGNATKLVWKGPVYLDFERIAAK